MSENRPEWQQGDSPVPGKASEAGTNEQPAYPGSPDQQENYPYASYGQQQPYGQQDPASYGQQQPYGQQDPASYGQPAGYPGYGQQQGAYPAYGQQAYPGYGQPGYPQVNPGQTMGLAGLITSIFVPILGLILGIIGLKQSRKVGMSNGMAVAGIVIGSVLTVLTILYIIFIIAIVASTAEYGY